MEIFALVRHSCPAFVVSWIFQNNLQKCILVQSRLIVLTYSQMIQHLKFKFHLLIHTQTRWGHCFHMQNF